MVFTSLEHEWIQNIIGLMEHVLDLKVKINYTTDLAHFNKYYDVGIKTLKSDMGSADTMYGYLWLNATEHSKRPVSELLNTIIHEMLHVKYPDSSEEWIVKETNKFISIQ